MNKFNTAHVTQHSGDQGKTNWKIYTNEKKDKLGELPKHLNEAEVFDIMALLRSAESQSFNDGIEFQKKKVPQTMLALQKIIRDLKNENARLLRENEKLGDTLDRVTRKEKV